MGPKYKLTDETKTLDSGAVLHRIEALRNGPWGPAGNFGGWIESERNLSQEGDCWVYDQAWVCENAKVCGNAWVSGGAHIYGNAKVSEDAWVSDDAQIFGNAQVYEKAYLHKKIKISGNQKVNGYCHLDGDEKGQEFQVNNICICDYDYCNLKKYRGCCWEISQVYEGWVQAKHGDEEIAFRNEWLRKL